MPPKKILPKCRVAGAVMETTERISATLIVDTITLMARGNGRVFIRNEQVQNPEADVDIHLSIDTAIALMNQLTHAIDLFKRRKGIQ